MEDKIISNNNNKKHMTVMVKKASFATFGIRRTLISSKNRV